MIVPVRLPILSLGITAFVAAAMSGAIVRDPAYREALDRAGDIPLAGSALLPDPARTVELVGLLGDAGRAAYFQFLGLDNWFVLAALLFLLSVSGTLLHFLSGRWALAIAAPAIVYACADWAENGVLREMLSRPALASSFASWAAVATTLKWVFGGTVLALVMAGLVRLFGSTCAWWMAFFQDVPYILDSLWRRDEFLVNREFLYTPAGPGQPAAAHARPCWGMPPFVFFCLTVLFVGYGPTFDGFCSIAPQPLPRVLPVVAGMALAWLLFFRLLPYVYRSIKGSVASRFKQLGRLQPPLDPVELAERHEITRGAVLVGAFFLFVPVIAATLGLLLPSIAQFNACAEATFAPVSVLRLAVCLGAIFAFVAACNGNWRTPGLVCAQAIIVAGAGAILWFGLAAQDDREADGHGYRHVFGAVAPLILLVLAAAPAVAAIIFRPSAAMQRWLHITGVPLRTRSIFRYLLTRRELFVQRGKDPDPTPGRVLFAMLQGVSYRGLQLLLPPALLAFAAPQDWLGRLTLFGFVMSFLLSTWGNLSRRWRQMIRHVDRLFLSGTALFVSLIVIVIAGLRIFRVDYVTTVLDAAPFGVLFSIVVMSYVLSWLVEYWLNRVVGIELLSVLGCGTDRPWMTYPIDFEPTPAIRVARDGRILGYHGIGRFLVTGTLVPPHVPAGGAPESRTAFHSYDLLELFRVLAGRDSDRVAEIVRNTNLYFYAMNALFLLVFAGVAIAYWHLSRSEPAAVVSVRVAPSGTGVKDLAAHLVAAPGDERPAVVIAASGGGTRAALYTSHVLQGLHGIGADRDIVLASGVSGGGVALAYFAAHYQVLTGSQASAGHWDLFRQRIGGNLIGDVLEGASEWRIFGATSLSVLLAESFERHLLRGVGKATMRLGDAPALILNTTITGHPVEDSEVLVKTLDRVRGASAAACREAARPYKMMNGGRLVFTNLQNVSAFPGAAGPLPNTRLPYSVVNDLDVPLAHAAALNANFPPVFPSARVVVRDLAGGTACPERSYYVTDGGAQENLGLVSALYAVQGALRDLAARCGKERCRLRPIHFVIAEASATAYDYEQDRGVSAGVGGAKERMTGGLTSVLVAQTRQMYVALGADANGVRLHYLPLPLPFRSRGGFGTHWMSAGNFDLTDPRLRSLPGTFDHRKLPPLSTATVSKEQVDEIWLALHYPRTPYCENRGYGSVETDRIRRWICGAARDPDKPRDLHVEAWQSVVRELSR